MIDLFSERRMVENEVVFRQHNEQVQEGLDELARRSSAEGLSLFPREDNLLLHFYCECADENCRERIIMKLKEYKENHKKRDEFIIIPGHEVVAIERIVRKEPTYFVVQKHVDPPATVKQLNVTGVNNV